MRARGWWLLSLFMGFATFASAANESVPDGTYVLLEHVYKSNSNATLLPSGVRIADHFSLHRYNARDKRWYLKNSWAQNTLAPVIGPYHIMTFGQELLVTGRLTTANETAVTFRKNNQHWDLYDFAFGTRSIWVSLVPMFDAATGYGRFLAFFSDGSAYQAAHTPKFNLTLLGSPYTARGEIPILNVVDMVVPRYADHNERIVMLQKDALVLAEISSGKYQEVDRQALPPGTTTKASRVLGEGESIWLTGVNYQGQSGLHYLRYKVSPAGKITRGTHLAASALSNFRQTPLAVVSESGSLLVGDDQGDFFEVDASGRIGLHLQKYLPHLSPANTAPTHSLFQKWTPADPVFRIARIEFPASSYRGKSAFLHLLTTDPSSLPGADSTTDQFVQLLQADIRQSPQQGTFDAKITPDVDVEVLVEALNQFGRTTFDAIDFALQRDSNLLTAFHMYQANPVLKATTKGATVNLNAFAAKIVSLVQSGCATHLLDKIAQLQSK